MIHFGVCDLAESFESDPRVVEIPMDNHVIRLMGLSDDLALLFDKLLDFF